jgi:hypothetical protein
VTHAILARENHEAQLAELVESRRALEEGLGQAVDLLAYPNGNDGDYDERTMAFAEQAGYRAAITTRPGLAGANGSPFAMRRVLVTPHTDVGELLTKAGRAIRTRRWSRTGRSSR